MSLMMTLRQLTRPLNRVTRAEMHAVWEYWQRLWSLPVAVFVLLSMMSPISAEPPHPLVTWDDLAAANAARNGAPEIGAPSGVTELRDGAATNQVEELESYDPFGSAVSAVDALLEAGEATPQLLDQTVTVDGYVLPLSSRKGRVVEFLLVPWVGACIHAPSPTPDQIIHVSYPTGLKIGQDFEPMRLSGTLKERPAAHELFLVDGTRSVPAIYALDDVVTAGAPGKIVASSVNELPLSARIQVWINALFTETMAGISKEGSVKALAFALFIAFGYGALHTFGPGHGKAVVISYFVGTGGSLGRGVKMGIRIAAFHVLSALMVVLLLDLVVRQTTGTAPSDYRAIRLISYALIVLIGSAMLWQAIAAIKSRQTNSHHHVHGAHGHGGCAACASHGSEKSGGWLAVAVGAVPCTGALLVMLFGLANDLLWPAVFMVVAISAGMAVAMSALGVAAIYGRNWAEQGLAGNTLRRLQFDNVTRIAGAVSVLVIGTSLFALTLAQHPIFERTPTTLALQTGTNQVSRN
ncbi:MAG: DUF3299 domain-containing protein [Pseudomonadota bacterium]